MQERETSELRLLIEIEGKPQHVHSLASAIGISEMSTLRFLICHGHGLWVHLGSFHLWKLTLRRSAPG